MTGKNDLRVVEDGLRPMTVEEAFAWIAKARGLLERAYNIMDRCTVELPGSCDAKSPCLRCDIHDWQFELEEGKPMHEWAKE